MYNIQEIITKLHFDYKLYCEENDITSTSGQLGNATEFSMNWATPSTENKTFNAAWLHLMRSPEKFYDYLVNKHADFDENLNTLITEDVKEFLVKELTDHPSVFQSVIHGLSRFKYFSYMKQEKSEAEEDVKRCVNELIQNGITKINLFTDEDLSETSKFQDSIENILGDTVKHAGYVHANGDLSMVFNNQEKINDGQVRLQSKNLNFEMPGMLKLTQNQKLHKIFNYWYGNSDLEFFFVRKNLEWIQPAEVNHNYWHIDVCKDQLKVMILLVDVDYDTAPMFYAKGSHWTTRDIELKFKHARFKYGSKILPPDERPTDKVFRPHVEGADNKHIAYVSDEVVDNYPDEISDKNRKITIDNHEYENFICTGKRGDCIIFESSGFHSGNRSFGKTRKNVVLTTPETYSFKNSFLSFIGKDEG